MCVRAHGYVCVFVINIYTQTLHIMVRCVVFACARVCVCSCVDVNRRKKNTLYCCFTAALLLFYGCIVAEFIGTGDLAKN